MSLAPRVVLVHRRTELEELVATHGTRGQAAFFLRTRGRDVAELEERDRLAREALETAGAMVPLDWRRGSVERADLPRFLFAPDDVVVVVGQDGLVANVAKYLHGQPVIGIDPEPGRNAGVLVRHAAERLGDLLRDLVAGTARITERTMVRATLDDGQELLALNEVFVGHPSHQTARYELQAPGAAGEPQASSGVIVATGTGATGWCRSIATERQSRMALPAPDEPRLVWFVREAWPSPATGTAQTEGDLRVDRGEGRDGGPDGDALALVAASDRLVAFGDGMEDDALTISWGQGVRLGLASRSLRLVS